jgi:hypothetical protein
LGGALRLARRGFRGDEAAMTLKRALEQANREERADDPCEGEQHYCLHSHFAGNG